MHAPCFPVSVRDVVLLGSKERMEGAVDGSMLEKIFLLKRLKRLENALSRKTGWKASVKYAVIFLNDAPGIYKGTLDEEEVDSNASFWRFARGSLVKLQAQMQKSALVLTTELPLCHIDTTTINAMVKADSLMANLVDCMPLEPPAESTSWFNAKSDTSLCEQFAMLLTFCEGKRFITEWQVSRHQLRSLLHCHSMHSISPCLRLHLLCHSTYWQLEKLT